MENMRNAGYQTPFSPLEAAVADYVTTYLNKRDSSEAGNHAGNEKVREAQ